MPACEMHEVTTLSVKGPLDMREIMVYKYMKYMQKMKLRSCIEHRIYMLNTLSIEVWLLLSTDTNCSFNFDKTFQFLKYSI